ncbi:unnamed protein product, partial [marine sediment metagenome]
KPRLAGDHTHKMLRLWSYSIVRFGKGGDLVRGHKHTGSLAFDVIPFKGF